MHIVKGSTYRDTLRWATSECRFVAATLVPGAPVRFNAPAHGLVDGWSVSIEGHNSFDAAIKHRVRVVDADTVELPCVNGMAYKAGAAVLRYNAPTELAGYVARMHIRDKIGGTLLMELTTEALAGEPRITIDDAAKTIVREIPASVTEAIAWKKGVYDFEMVQGDYVVKIDAGDVTVADEVTV